MCTSAFLLRGSRWWKPPPEGQLSGGLDLNSVLGRHTDRTRLVETDEPPTPISCVYLGSHLTALSLSFPSWMEGLKVLFFGKGLCGFLLVGSFILLLINLSFPSQRP